jgi:hypothetical protein
MVGPGGVAEFTQAGFVLIVSAKLDDTASDVHIYLHYYQVLSVTMTMTVSQRVASTTLHFRCRYHC